MLLSGLDYMAALLAFVATSVVLLVLQPVAERLNLLDQPGGRKDHANATPVTGGLAVFVGCVAAHLGGQPASDSLLAFLTAAGLVVAMGVYDDLHDMRWYTRILIQTVATLIIIYWGGVRVEQLGPALGFETLSLGWLSVPFTVFATVGIINAMNMIDGADGQAGLLGLAALVMLMAAALYAGNTLLTERLSVLCAALLAFLGWNMRLPWRPRAKVFLGNAGSALLGLIIAWVCFRLTQNPGHPVNPVLALWLLPVPIMDCLVVSVRRLRQGRSPFSAGRDHIHHLLQDAGRLQHAQCLRQGRPHHPQLRGLREPGGLAEVIHPDQNQAQVAQSEVIPDRNLRVLVHYSVLNRGGAERSILRLLSGLAERSCTVELVLTSAGGALEEEIDPRVTVHHLRTIRTWNRGGTQENVLSRLGFAAKWFLARMQESWRRRAFRSVAYDVAICGSSGLSPGFICNAVQAKRRFVFVRSDPAQVKDPRWREGVQRFSGRIDGYLCVSEFVRRSMQATYPAIRDKCLTSYNLINAAQIRERAMEHGSPFPPGNGKLRVLSVCRLQEASKALMRMVEVHRRLLESGVDHEWHVLGDGADRPLLEYAIQSNGVGESLLLHGAVTNPYPWYRHADICAVLSRYEGLCGVVNEARVLERPVIATRFAGIEEQITTEVNGLIVEQSVDAICTGMKRLLQEPELRQRLANGGYPHVLLDDEAKVDVLLKVLVGDRSEGGQPN